MWKVAEGEETDAVGKAEQWLADCSHKHGQVDWIQIEIAAQDISLQRHLVLNITRLSICLLVALVLTSPALCRKPCDEPGIDTAPGWQVDSVGGRSMTALAAKVTASISEVKQVSFITAVLMAVALCFHSILEVSILACAGLGRIVCGFPTLQAG